MEKEFIRKPNAIYSSFGYASHELSTINTFYNTSNSRFFHTSKSFEGDKSIGEEKEPVRKRRLSLTGILYLLGACVILHFVGTISKWYYKKKDYDHEQDIIVLEDPDFSKSSRMFVYKNCVLPYFTKDSLDAVQNFQVKQNDTFVVSFPKSGSRIMLIIFVIQ